MAKHYIREAAEAHALEVLGFDEFQDEPDKVEAIVADFEAGAKYMEAQNEYLNKWKYQ